MTSTVIECSLCHNVVEITGRRIEMPFVCPPCEREAEMYDAMAPKVTSQTVQAHGDYPYTAEDYAAMQKPLPTLEHDTATIENTTLLIADLEEQVRIANTLIEDMSTQLKEDAGTAALLEQL